MPDFQTPDGTRIHYEDEGEGPALLCLSGLTRNGRDFQHVLPHLGGLRVIRPDYRGRGQSDWPGPDGYTVPQEAADQVALLDHLGLGRAAVLGTSRGGLIAMYLAATSKERLSGVALNDIGPVVEEAGLATIRGYVGEAPPQRTLEEAARARAEGWTAFRGVPMERWRDEVAAHYEEGPDGLSLRYDPRLREAVVTALSQPAPADPWPIFEALAGLPLALIRGEGSDILSRETADEMRRRRPDMVYAEVAGRGHVPFLDEPEALEALRLWREMWA